MCLCICVMKHILQKMADIWMHWTIISHLMYIKKIKIKQKCEQHRKSAASYLLQSVPLPVGLLLSRVSLWGEESELLETETCIYPNYLLGNLYQSVRIEKTSLN